MLTRLPDITDAPSFWALLAHQRGRLAFDVGANIGQAAHLLAARFDRVVSFEPCAEALAVLAVEAPNNVTVVPFAVSSGGGRISLDETEHSIRTGQLTTGSKLNWGPVVGHRWVESTTLVAAATEWGTPDLVKIDTEGHELEVLAGAFSLIRARCACWLIEVHDRAHGPKIEELFAGYRIRRIDHDYLAGQEAGLDHFYLEAQP